MGKCSNQRDCLAISDPTKCCLQGATLKQKNVETFKEKAREDACHTMPREAGVVR